jgi:hypothetical protein
MSAVAATIMFELSAGAVASIALELRLSSVFQLFSRGPRGGPRRGRKVAPATGGGRLRASGSSAPGEGRDDGSCALERQCNSDGAPEFPASIARKVRVEGPKAAGLRGSGLKLRAGQAIWLIS